MIIGIDNLEEHPYHRKMYNPIKEGYFQESLKRTNGEPIHAPVVVPSQKADGNYQLIAGAGRADEMIRNGAQKLR